MTAQIQLKQYTLFHQFPYVKYKEHYIFKLKIITSNFTNVLQEAGTSYPKRAPGFTRDF